VDREIIVSFGILSPAQKRALRPYVHGRVVYDLGSGNDLELAQQLTYLRVKEVVAVDTYPSPWAYSTTGYGPKGTSEEIIRYVRQDLVNFHEPVRTAFVSWPSNRPNPGLLRILKGASVVIYLGTNMDGTACGTPDLFRYLATRSVLAHEPDMRNTLIVYGQKGPAREPLPEELAGYDQSKIYYSIDAYRRVTAEDLKRS